MSTQVLIVSPKTLFREGVKRLLHSNPEVNSIKQATTLEQAKLLAQSQTIDIVIVDQDIHSHNFQNTISQMFSIPSINTVAISLEGGDLQIFRREQVSESSVERLIAALVRQDSEKE